jgi:hypothetical protein
MEMGLALLAVGAAATAMGLQWQPLAGAAKVLGGGFGAVLPPVVDTLSDTPRSALRRAKTLAQARGVSFAEGVRGDARECLTRAERRAEPHVRSVRSVRLVVQHVHHALS